MTALKKTLDAIAARFSGEILAALSRASVEELQGALPQRKGRRSQTPQTPGTSPRSKSTTGGHALEIMAANLLRHLKDHGPTRSEELRRVLAISRQDMVKALAVAVDTWKAVGKKGEKRSTTYYAKKTRGPKPQITLGDRMRVAAVMGR